LRQYAAGAKTSIADLSEQPAAFKELMAVGMSSSCRATRLVASQVFLPAGLRRVDDNQDEAESRGGDRY